MSEVDDQNATSHAFGSWRFDAGTGDLSDGTTTSRLEPQVAKLLDYFLTHQDTLISRDELLAAAWDHRIVSDHAINRCISILRHKLTPDDKHAYIETVVRRGFISHFPPPLADEVPPKDAPRRGRVQRIGMLAGLMVVVLFAGARLLPDFSDSLRVPPSAGRTQAPVVAVLPFVSAAPSSESEFFANGMHDDLLTNLAQLQSIRVISRTSVSEYRGDSQNIREIGRLLGADAVLEGGVQRVGDQVRINVQLIDAKSDTHLWAEQYDRELTPANIFGIQTEIARSIASALDSALTAQDATQLEALPTANMAAYRAYHEAIALRAGVNLGTPEYIAALERAVSLDPDYVRAWAELAGSLSFKNITRRDPDSIQRLEGILERIQSLAPQSAELLIAQTYYTYYIVKDHDLAFRLIEQARELRPNDPQVLNLRSWIQRRQGDFDGAVETIRLGLALDPLNPYWIDRLVSGLSITHRYDEAIQVLDDAPVDSIGLSLLRSLLSLRSHGQPGRLLDDLLAMQREYGVEVEPFQLWEAHITARDFDGAAALLDAMDAAPSTVEAWDVLDLPDLDLARSITDRFLDTGIGNPSTLAETRAKLERKGQTGMRGFEPNYYLIMAYITALEGNRAETQRLVRTWFREAAQDLVERAVKRHHACRALGMAGVAPAAVDCLRSTLAEPSLAHPFIEPSLPYYDAIRGDPLYSALLAENRGG